MDIDPHTIQLILTKVEEQLRCPQCRKRMEVNLESLKVLGNGVAVMQVQCTACDAHIMLHTSITLVHAEDPKNAIKNASSKLTIGVDEIKTIKAGIKESGGSFIKMFDPPKNLKNQ